jgi:hypothetical protein
VPDFLIGASDSLDVIAFVILSLFSSLDIISALSEICSLFPLPISDGSIKYLGFETNPLDQFVNTVACIFNCITGPAGACKMMNFFFWLGFLGVFVLSTPAS